MQRAERSGLVIAIDGPSGSGKSTTARGVARTLGLRYLDSGAMYRAVTWLAMREGVTPAEPDRLAALAGADLHVSEDPDHPTVSIAGHDVTAAIRSAGVTAAVSVVSAVPGVRAVLVAQQQAVIGAGGIVVEGRDIGTTVAPDAAVKVFLIADAAERAHRRAREIAGPEAAHAVPLTQHELARRDQVDSTRAASPLARADDAVVIDSTDLTLEQVVDLIVGLARKAARA